MQRRAFTRLALVGAAAPGLAALGGCGFQLRRPAQLRIRRLHLAGFVRLALGEGVEKVEGPDFASEVASMMGGN